ncbi:MAG: leucine-rich repeat protein [Aquiluna sp.]
MLLKSKKLSLTAVLALLGATLVAPPAWAATVNCSTSGSFTLTDNVVTGNSSCAGEAVIPNSVTSIGAEAFRSAGSLVSVTFEADSVLTQIGSFAFHIATSLESIIIPNSVTSIDDHAFRNAISLASVTFEADSVLESIGDYAFYRAPLESITFPSTVTSIGDWAFFANDAKSLTSITFGGNAPTIGTSAFYNVDAVVNIGSAATGFGTETTWNGLTIVRASEISSVDCTTGTFAISDNVVTGHTNCAGVAVIPNGVTSIGANAFRSASALTSITIPNSVTSIGNNAFLQATALPSIAIPNSVTSIGNAAFYGASALETVTFEAGSALNSIGQFAFYGRNAITSITIPNSVTSIGNQAFRFSWSLTSITFEGNAPATVGTDAFNNMGADSVANIGSAATGFGTAATWNSLRIVRASGVVLVNCSTSGTFTVTDNVVTGNTDCVGSAVIPNSVTSIGVYAFYNATALASVTFEAGSVLTSIGPNAFRNTTSLTSITIPNSVTSIEAGAFRDAHALTSITIPNSVTTIGNAAFMFNTALTSITIPNSVTSIGVSAFDGATSMTSVTFAGNAPSVGTSAFRSVGTDPVANIGLAATGFGTANTWNGLTIVRAPDPTPPTATPVAGDTNAGATLVINGTNMDRITQVTIGGTVVPITARTTTSITVTVPAGLAAGGYTISLTTDDATLLAGGVAQVVAGEVEAAINQKVNAGSFNTYVAVYAKGYKGQTLAWKIAGKWFKVVITKDYQVFQRKTIAVGLEVKVDLFIDGERLLAKTVLTR